MLTLALDASTAAGSAALIRDGSVVASARTDLTGQRAEGLMPAVAALLHESAVDVSTLGQVACGAGPGRFTSLRIAASIAKGIASARALPLLVAPSPLLIVAGAEKPLPAGRWIAVIDAMRGDVFAQRVDVDAEGRLRVGDEPRLLSRVAAHDWAEQRGARLVGPDEATSLPPHARGFARLMREGLAAVVDLATWEPDYGRKAEAQVRWEAAHGHALESR